MAISKKTNQADFEVTKTNELLTPDGEGTGIMVTVKSDLCAAAKGVQKRIAAAAISLELAQRSGENDDAVIRWLDKQEELQVDRIFLCTVSIDWNGEEWDKGDGGLELTKPNLKTMLAEDWVSVQFAKWIKDVTDFIKA